MRDQLSFADECKIVCFQLSHLDNQRRDKTSLVIKGEGSLAATTFW